MARCLQLFSDLGSREIVEFCVAKTKALSSCAVTAQLLCAFVFANAKSRFSPEAAHFVSLPVNHREVVNYIAAPSPPPPPPFAKLVTSLYELLVFPFKKISVLLFQLFEYLSRVMRKPTFWFPTWSDTNPAVQSQKMAKGFKFWI